MYNEKRVKAYHDNIVDGLATFLDGVGYHNALFPDRLDGNNIKPDLHIPVVAVFEVKVITPTAKDAECDKKAAIDLKTKGHYELTGSIKGRAREEDIREATKQLRAVNENIKILVFASPLNFIPSNHHLLEELHGNQYIDFYRTGLTSTPTLPYTKSLSTNKLREQGGIDAILLIRGSNFTIHNTKLYMVSEQESDVFEKLSADKIESFWGFKRGALL